MSFWTLGIERRDERFGGACERARKGGRGRRGEKREPSEARILCFGKRSPGGNRGQRG